MKALRDKFVDGAYSGEDLAYVEGLMRSGTWSELTAVYVQYLKYANPINIDLVARTALESHDPYLTSETIKCLSYRRENSQVFKDIVKKYIQTVTWDPYKDVLFAALNTVPMLYEFDNDVRKAMRENISSKNELVRDSVVLASQIYAGVAEEDMLLPEGDGSLIERVSDKTINWISENLKE